jgi:hypothetical protein
VKNVLSFKETGTGAAATTLVNYRHVGCRDFIPLQINFFKAPYVAE